MKYEREQIGIRFTHEQAAILKHFYPLAATTTEIVRRLIVAGLRYRMSHETSYALDEDGLTTVGWEDIIRVYGEYLDAVCTAGDRPGPFGNNFVFVEFQTDAGPARWVANKLYVREVDGKNVVLPEYVSVLPY